MTDKMMTVSDVARELGLGVQRTKQLDDELQPMRIGRIKMRLYNSVVVARVKKERAKAKRSS